ncbi:MAG: isopeptide-forming domain-containing fimbrial protein [Ruminococcus sp.]|nr:isopeptide-forming domain-containing fimbrial protein [Ruminococcus sp.]
MKHSKKFAAMMAALALTACSIAPMFSFAEGEEAPKYTITVGTTAANGYSGDKAEHTYEAYQIFKGTVEIGEDGEPTGKLEGIEWGSSITETGIYAELAKITINDENPFTDEDGNDLTSAAEVAAVLGSASDDSALAKAFADAIGANLTGTGVEIKDDAEFEGGYYLIQDKNGSPVIDDSDVVEGAKTRYILKVVGNITINPKSGVPSVEKKVVENTKKATESYEQGAYKPDNEYLNDVADYCISDTVPFELIGTLPDAYADYDTYFYQFTDTLGSQFNDPTDIEVVAVNEGEEEADITSSFTKSAITANEDGAKVFTLTCDNLKGINGVTIDKDTVIVVRYNAVLNENAVIGLPGQENKVDLTYSRNPNHKGNGGTTPEGPDDHGKTPEDKVIVFTYELDTNKYLDKADAAHLAAAGQAGFKLYRTVDGVEQVATLINNKITGWVDVTDANRDTAGTQIETVANNSFNFIGLDDGTYTLVETKVPTGYNKMADLEMTINATTANNQSWIGEPDKALTALKLTHTGDDYEYIANNLEQDAEDGTKADNLGIVRDEIINKSGSTLPSTGGIGTTIFYLGGGAMVAVAGVFLITKKRMGKREN